ncbi:hypothetical protein ACBI99_43925 [Nonomuraea sp. ATR24]|uniref:hypothetical protein n=1 Tax=Nonomuraea sp. ATR24 TaxID=1676744 RepID=UPI0035C10266
MSKILNTPGRQAMTQSLPATTKTNLLSLVDIPATRVTTPPDPQALTTAPFLRLLDRPDSHVIPIFLLRAMQRDRLR